jgi:uncharacterized C2H2 Zn-finger protein
VHLADDIEAPGRSWSVTIHPPGEKPASYKVDVCEEHGKPLAELGAFLHELGRPIGAPVATSGPGATCPTCGVTLKDRNGLSAHVRRNHGTTLTELEGRPPRGSAERTTSDGNPDPFTCPECGDTFNSPQGIGVHRSKKHGVRGTKSKPGKAAS